MGIELSMIAGLCYSSSSVNARGSERHLLTDQETLSFGLDEGTLKQAVAACFGKPPELAQLHGSLHQTHDWAPVRTVLVVQSAAITGVGSVPISGPLDADGARVTFTAANLWSPTEAVTPAEPIDYRIVFPASGGGPEVFLSYSHQWGQSTIESTTIDLGHLPRDVTDTLLVADRKTLSVRIVYDAYLTGEVAVHYRDGHQGHRFWALDVDTVMAAGELLNGRHFAEDISVRYHASTRIVRTDLSGGLTTLFAPGIRSGEDLALTGA